jgi:hypothetical protein
LDDYDVLSTIKNWMFHPDKVLSTLCRCLVDRRLFKVKLQAEPFQKSFVAELRNDVSRSLKITYEESRYFVFEGQAENTTYDPSDERIDILFRDGTIKDISQVDNALIHHNLASTVKKFYICYLRSSQAFV